MAAAVAWRGNTASDHAAIGARCSAKSAPTRVGGGVGAVLVVTTPAAAADVVRECVALGIKRVWLHRSVGTGSASEEAIAIARAANLTLLPTGCPMMFCEPRAIAHRCLRWCLNITGHLPATIPA